MDDLSQVIAIIRKHFPEVQAIYLFGSFGTPYARPESDLDIGILLPPTQARETGNLLLGALHDELTRALGRDVDLINLRMASTVLAKEAVLRGSRIFCADVYAADEFEMLTLSYYQHLNQERHGIVDAILETGRVLQ